MAKNLIINGVTYNGVESLDIPTDEGKTAKFPDISDSTVTAETLAEGVTAYGADGEKIVGTVKPVTEALTVKARNSGQTSNRELRFSYTFTSPTLFQPNSRIEILEDLSVFGDATPEDVAKEKVFTSSAGRRAIGTHTCESGGGGSIISFTMIAAATGGTHVCEAVAGMTFNDWLVSEYNLTGVTSINTLFWRQGISANQWNANYIIMPTAVYVAM